MTRGHLPGAVAVALAVLWNVGSLAGGSPDTRSTALAATPAPAWRHPSTINRNQVQAVEVFLASLDTTQRERVAFPVDSPERTRWRRTPGERTGLALSDLDEDQRVEAHRMLRSVLSTQGYLKALGIMLNEDIQARVEPSLGPERYWIAVYGEPSESDAWGWRIEGHHLSVNLTFQGSRLVSASPSIYGMHPALIRSEGPRSGVAVLSGEEEIARRLARELRDRGVSDAFGRGAPPPRLHAESRDIEIEPEGAFVGQLSDDARTLVRSLIAEYLLNYEAVYAEAVLGRLDFDGLRFVWYGGLEPGDHHYYRIQGGDFVIEYEHYGRDRAGGNHIHCLWRDGRTEPAG